MIKRNKVSAKYVATHAQDAYTDLGFGASQRKIIFKVESK